MHLKYHMLPNLLYMQLSPDKMKMLKVGSFSVKVIDA